jgi:hypothetical protein
VGTDAPDTSLYRKTSLGGWYSPEAFFTAKRFEIQGDGDFEPALVSYKAGDTYPQLLIYANGAMEFGSGTAAADTATRRDSANLLVMDPGDSFGMDGTWNGGHLRLGDYHLWVDATGDLRIKSSAPSSDGDGSVVGGQS